MGKLTGAEEEKNGTSNRLINNDHIKAPHPKNQLDAHYRSHSIRDLILLLTEEKNEILLVPAKIAIRNKSILSLRTMRKLKCRKKISQSSK